MSEYVKNTLTSDGSPRYLCFMSDFCITTAFLQSLQALVLVIVTVVEKCLKFNRSKEL